jgi:hypothetical protein
MYKRLISLIIVLSFSHNISAQNEKIKLTIVDTGNPDKILNIPLKAGEQINTITSGIDAGDLTAITTLPEFEVELSSIGISGGNPPTINTFSCTSGPCSNVSTSSTTVTNTIDDDAVYCVESLNNSEVDLNIDAVSFITNTSFTTNSGGEYKLECGNSFGETVKTVQINLSAPPIVSMQAVPSSVTSGSSSQVSWTITNNPTTCSFTGDWPGGEQLNVSPTTYVSPVSVTNITSNKNLSLSCTNSAGSGSDSASITITGGSTWPSCGGAGASILGGNEDRTIIADGDSVGGQTNGTYNQFYGASTPASSPLSSFLGATFQLSLTRNQYIAGQFNSGSANLTAKFDFTTPGGDQGPVPNGSTVTISDCPGDFTQHLGQSRCEASGGNPSLFFSDSPSANPAIFCKLDKNTTYYLNIVHANEGSNNFATSLCPSSYCGILAAPSNVDVE